MQQLQPNMYQQPQPQQYNQYPEFQQPPPYIRPPISKTAINNARHKAERPLHIMCIVIGIVAALLAAEWFFSLGSSENTIDALQQANAVVGAAEDEDAEADRSYANLMLLIFFSPLIIFFSMQYWYALTKAYAIRVTQRNFPEIYYKSVEYARLLGLKKVPPVYIEQQNGVINAFAAAVFGKRYAMLNAELVDVAYMEHKDFEPVYFVLAHEFGHIYFGHVTFWHNLWVYVAHLIPVIGSIHSRAREYSCDRVAQLLTERYGAQEFMVVTAGRHLYKYVDVDDYLQSVKYEGGFGVRMVNLLASHPITPKRIAALADPQLKSGKLL